MNQTPNQPIDLAQANTKLRHWRRQHADLATRQALFRDRVLGWVVESMRFENEPVTMARLQELLANQETTHPAA